MKLTENIKKWVHRKLKENWKNIIDNSKEIKDNFRKILFSIFVIAIGFFVLKDYSLFNIIFYSLTVIWVFFFNTLILVRRPYYFYFTMVAILVGDAIKPLFNDGLKFLSEGNYLMFFVYVGVWAAIRFRFNQLKKESPSEIE